MAMHGSRLAAGQTEGFWLGVRKEHCFWAKGGSQLGLEWSVAGWGNGGAKEGWGGGVSWSEWQGALALGKQRVFAWAL